jgi:hypothetical protein
MGASNRSIPIPVTREEKQKKREKGKGARGRLAGLAAALGWPKGCPAFIFIFLLLFFSFFYFVISLKIETKLFGFGYFQICKLLNHVPRCLATQNNLFGVI